MSQLTTHRHTPSTLGGTQLTLKGLSCPSKKIRGITCQGSILSAGQMLKVALQMTILLCHGCFESSLKPDP